MTRTWEPVGLVLWRNIRSAPFSGGVLHSVSWFGEGRGVSGSPEMSSSVQVSPLSPLISANPETFCGTLQ